MLAVELEKIALALVDCRIAAEVPEKVGLNLESKKKQKESDLWMERSEKQIELADLSFHFEQVQHEEKLLEMTDLDETETQEELDDIDIEQAVDEVVENVVGDAAEKHSMGCMHVRFVENRKVDVGLQEVGRSGTLDEEE